MRRKFIVKWRLYGYKDWCSVRITAFCKNDALAAASQQLNNHMIQLGEVTEPNIGVPKQNISS